MIVIAGFAGLKSLSLSFSNFFDPDLKITPILGKTFTINSKIISELNKNKEIMKKGRYRNEEIISFCGNSN